MDPENFYEPNRDPLVWGIETISDMTEASVKVDALIAKGEVKTIIVDSLTFYADLYFTHLLTMQGNKPDSRRAYGDLNNHLRDLRVKLHSKRVNVIWTGLEKQPDSENPVGGPMIPGQQATKFAAGCDFIFYHRQFQEGQQGSRWEIRSRKWGPYVAGGRDGGILPDPLIEPTYRSFVDSLKSISNIIAPAAPALVQPQVQSRGPVVATQTSQQAPSFNNGSSPKPAPVVRRIVTNPNPSR
jgi:hypothetical protein